MTLFSLALCYLRAKPSNTLLHIILMALGTALMAALLLFGYHVQERLYRDGAGIDVVVGAKGSPLQLILSSVQHMDIPTGNIPFSEAEKIKRNQQIKQVIPIALGDTYKQFRIVGTTQDYLTHFGATYQEGQSATEPMQAVIGAWVAQESGLKIGDSFFGSHGLIPGGDSHESHPYTVTGILKPTGAVLDRLIVTPLQSVWDVHSEPHDNHAHDHHHHHESHENKEVTALLVTYRTRTAVLNFPRYINQKTSMQAASPAFEMARLVNVIGIGSSAAMAFAGFLIASAMISALIGLINNIRDRRYDVAIFRTLGASKRKIMLLVIIEGMMLAVSGSIIGLILGHGVIELIGQCTSVGTNMALSGWVFLPNIWWIWGAFLCGSLLASLIPAYEAYKIDIRKTLTQH